MIQYSLTCSKYALPDGAPLADMGTTAGAAAGRSFEEEHTATGATYKQ